MMDEYHTPVLTEAVLTYLHPVMNGIYVDGTLGGGGHAERILAALTPGGKLIGFDMDRDALNFAQQRLGRFGDNMVVLLHDNFANVRTRLRHLKIDRVQGLLLDLGVSSRQIDEPQRGFSFQSDSPLDMRMGRQQHLDGWKVVNMYDQDRLAEIFWKYGEEIHSRRIARKIVHARKDNPIGTTGELAALVESAVGKRFLQKSLARVFQAIRIEVNDELENLDSGLRDAVDILEQGGRIVVISYHSLEDRIVKNFFREQSSNRIPSGTPFAPDKPRQPKLQVLTRKPVTPTPEEINRNPRARSAKLRAAERI